MCQSDFVSFFITNAKGRQIKKLYSNWYDQAEHLNQISNIKIRQSTRLGNKTGPFSSILCLICCEWAGAGCAPPRARCTIWRAELSKDGARAHEWEKHGTLFFTMASTGRPPCAVWSQWTTEEYQKILVYKKPQSINQFCLQQTLLPLFASVWSYFTLGGGGGWGGGGCGL